MNDVVGRRLLDWRVRTVCPHVSGRLLDIGCGTNQLVKAYGNGVGVDVYPWPGADMVVEDSSQLPFEAGSFDTVTVIAALNHIPYREKVIAEAARLLKPGGRFLATMLTPGISQVWHWVRSPWDADQHERGMEEGETFGFRQAEMVRMFQGGGFHLDWSRPFMLGLNRLYAFRKRA